MAFVVGPLGVEAPFVVRLQLAHAASDGHRGVVVDISGVGFNSHLSNQERLGRTARCKGYTEYRLHGRCLWQLAWAWTSSRTCSNQLRNVQRHVKET